MYWTNNAAFESESGQRGLVFLNDEDPIAWKIFAKWLYHGKTSHVVTR